MVNMWVYEEMVDGRKLTEIINTEHENVKYLPGHKLPKNVVGCCCFREFILHSPVPTGAGMSLERVYLSWFWGAEQYSLGKIKVWLSSTIMLTIHRWNY